MNYILHSKTKKNVKLNFDFCWTFFQEVYWQELDRSLLQLLRQKSLKIPFTQSLKDCVIFPNQTKLNSTSREKYISLGWKLIMALCPAKHELTMNSKEKKNIKIIQWTSLRMNSKSKIELSRKEFYSRILDWKKQLGKHWKFYHLRQYLREHKYI